MNGQRYRDEWEGEGPMDFLTHLFLPLTVAYVLRQELFNPPYHLALAVFGVLPDFDKFLGQPGLLHSLVTLVPLAVILMAVEYGVRDRTQYSSLAAAFLGSHLLLDVLDGGPAPLLYPFVETGIGVQYPIRIAFGEGPLGVSLEHAPVAVRVTQPQPGFNTYGFLRGYGIAWGLVFAVIYLGLRNRGYATEEEQ